MQDNVTTTENPTPIRRYKEVTFDNWITYLSLGGLMIDEDDGHVYKMTLTEFCTKFNVSKMTIVRWRKNTPDLAQRIEQRRNEVTPMARVTALYNQMFLLAMQSQDKRAAVDAGKTLLGHFGNLQLPVQREEVKHTGGWVDIIAQAKTENIIEGEVINEPDADTTRSITDTSTLPQTP